METEYYFGRIKNIPSKNWMSFFFLQNKYLIIMYFLICIINKKFASLSL